MEDFIVSCPMRIITLAPAYPPLDSISKCVQMIEHGIKSGTPIQLHLYSSPNKHKTIVNFPTVSYAGNRSFLIYFKILKLIHCQLLANELISKRQLYYLDVALFEKQGKVDKCVDIIASSLNAALVDLNIIPSQKGLVYGNLDVNGYTITKDNGSVLIPSIRHFKISFETMPDRIVILEKDAILSGLISKDRESQCLGNIILITGRGFPDRLTKSFIYQLTAHFPQIPVHGYFDADIHGFMIFQEYSSKPIEKNSIGPTAAVVAAPNLKLKGAKLLGDTDFLMINERNIILTISQLKIASVSNLTGNLREIQRSLFLNVKRELQLSDVLFG